MILYQAVKFPTDPFRRNERLEMVWISGLYYRAQGPKVLKIKRPKKMLDSK